MLMCEECLARDGRGDRLFHRRVAVEFLARTGLRKGEFINLSVDAVVQIGSAYSLRVPVGKLHTDRYIPLHPQLKAFSEPPLCIPAAQTELTKPLLGATSARAPGSEVRRGLRTPRRTELSRPDQPGPKVDHQPRLLPERRGRRCWHTVRYRWRRPVLAPDRSQSPCPRIEISLTTRCSRTRSPRRWGDAERKPYVGDDEDSERTREPRLRPCQSDRSPAG
jgi:hypothetical protein